MRRRARKLPDNQHRKQLEHGYREPKPLMKSVVGAIGSAKRKVHGLHALPNKVRRGAQITMSEHPPDRVSGKKQRKKDEGYGVGNGSFHRVLV